MEFYVKEIGEPNFSPDKLQQDAELSMLMTQIETMLFTRKGDVLGDLDFGASLEDYVYELRYNDFQLKRVINEQLNKYIPLAQKYNVELEIDYAEEVDRHAVFLDITVDSRFQLGVYI
jgi:enolase